MDKMIDLKQYDAFMDLILDNLDDNGCQEYWSTDRELGEQLLRSVRTQLFGSELERQAEYEEYLRLKAKFDPKSDDRLMQNHSGDPDWEMVNK